VSGPPSEQLTLGFSPCPNDTFIFSALAGGAIDTGGIRFRTVIEDVEVLNRRALHRELDVTKVSFHAFALLREHYHLLGSGAALGRGCGPLVVAREPLEPADLAAHPDRFRIAIPGELTTAALLLRLFAPGARRLVVCPFDRIFDAVRSSRADAGVIIHEGRFTYRDRGLHKVIDLGEWWETTTGLPIPLGGIIASRALGAERVRAIEGWVRRSVLEARQRPETVREFVRSHAQEMAEDVIRAHIDLYVNEFTVDLGAEGMRAVEALLRMAEERGIVPGPA
jgi:5,8-dihydroxy-2-naphthoate synthase